MTTRRLAAAALLLLCACTGDQPYKPTGAINTMLAPHDPAYKDFETENRYKSVVRVTNSCGIGTGVLIGPNEVLTAEHVITCDDGTIAKEMQIWHAQTEFVSAEVVAVSETQDVARLKVHDHTFTNWVEVSEREPRVGDILCYVGGNALLERTLTKCGEYYGVDEYGRGGVALHVVPGNSGGPVFNSSWELIGLATHQDATSAFTSNSVKWEHAGSIVLAKHFP